MGKRKDPARKSTGSKASKRTKKDVKDEKKKRKVESSSTSESQSSEDDAETQLTHAIAATFGLPLAYALKYLCLSMFVLKEFGTYTLHWSIAVCF